MRKGGLEPPYPRGYQILSLARLPVPPLSRLRTQRNTPSTAGRSLAESQSRALPVGPRDGFTRPCCGIAPPPDLFHGLFEFSTPGDDRLRVAAPGSIRAVPDPQTGRPLKVASVELSDRSVRPVCTQRGAGGYVSFVSDLRLAFACPSCRTLVWLAGA